MLNESLEQFSLFANGFLSKIEEIAAKKGLESMHVCKNDIAFKVFLEFFNWVSIERYILHNDSCYLPDRDRKEEDLMES